MKEKNNLSFVDDLFEVEVLEKKSDFVPKRKKKSKISGLLELLIYIAAAVFVASVLIVFVVQRTDVIGHSMENTLSDQDSLLVDKISYRIDKPERFDVIIFRYLHRENTHYIKRIIGLPGETVQIVNGVIYINGEILEESYGLETIKESGVASHPIELGEDEYFVLGDNRNHSTDSRFSDVANIKKEQIIGKAWLRIWPLKKIGPVN